MTVRRALLGAAVLAVGVLGWLVLQGPGSGAQPDPTPAATEGTNETELVNVQRQDLTETERVNATVSFGAIRALPVEAEGIVTWAPGHGEVLAAGDIAVRVANRPVMLAAGGTPLYRELRRVPRGERDAAGTLVGQMIGLDVAQLQHFLIEQGFDDKGRLTEDGTFGPGTERAVRAWQRSVGHPATGRIDRSQLLFVDEDLRVEAATAVGQPFVEVMVTSTKTILTAEGSTTVRPFFPVDSTVSVAVGDEAIEGTVTRSTRVIDPETNSARQRIEVTVTGVDPDDLGGSVEMTGTLTRADDALTVPVRALLALTEGGWAVETPTVAGTELTAVELVSVVDTTAVITGLAEGDEVVVPL